MVDSLMSSLKAGSYRTYGSAWRKWQLYCQSMSYDVWSANKWRIADYLHWLADGRTVKLSNCQPYLSAINTAYRSMGLPRPAIGYVVDNVCRSLAARQKDERPGLRHRPLPAPQGRRLVEFAVDSVANESWAASDAAFDRATHALAFAVMYLTGSRPTSIRRLPHDTGIVVTPRGDVTVCRRYVKTDDDSEGGDQVGRLPVTLPVRFRSLGKALLRYQAERAQRFPEASTFFSLSAVSSSSSVASIAQFKVLLARLGVLPPPGCAYVLRSLRSGFASACMSLDVSPERICFIGGWVPGSRTMVRYYVEYGASFPVNGAAARWLFGHLRAV